MRTQNVHQAGSMARRTEARMGTSTEEGLAQEQQRGGESGGGECGESEGGESGGLWRVWWRVWSVEERRRVWPRGGVATRQ